VTKGWRCKRKRLQRQSPEGHFDFHLTGGEMALVEDLPATIKMDVSFLSNLANTKIILKQPLTGNEKLELKIDSNKLENM
jgi:hypothetical protein